MAKRPTIKEMLAQSPYRFRPSHPNGPQHVLEAQQFSRQLLTEMFELARLLKKKPYLCMRGKHGVIFSEEKTTRTRSSLAAALRRLGGTCEFISSEDSSQGKGEPLDETVRALIANDANLIGIRCNDPYSLYRAAMASTVPLINLGTGTSEHPTQTLADLYTLFRKLGRLDNLKIAIVGDLALSRVVHSLLYALSKFDDNEIYLVSPDHLRIRGDLRYYLHDKGIKVTETTELDWVLPLVDACYQTRAQKERAKDNPLVHLGLAPYNIGRKEAIMLKDEAGIMHPLPRTEELAKEIDDTPKDWYHDQMAYGADIRTALLAKIFG